MKHLVDPVIKSAADLKAVSKKMIDDSVKFFRSNLGRIPLFSSIVALEDQANVERDETHYFLIPYRLSEAGYALYTQRTIPQGVGPENDLPKARVFHLPAQGTDEALEELLLSQLTQQQRQGINHDAPLADRLDVVAEEIDKQSNMVTGGLILIGGAVAIANPLLGIGIAAKALLPTLGSKLTKHGIHHVTDWLREKKRESSDKKASQMAQNEIKKLKPETRYDDTLALLEEALATEDPQHDPHFKFTELLSTPERAKTTVFTASAISCIYEQCLADKTSHEDACLHKPDISWLESLSKLS